MSTERWASRVTGLGAISCLGIGTDRLWNACENQRSGIDGGLGKINDASLAEIRLGNRRSPWSSSFQATRQNLPESKSVDLAFHAFNQAAAQAGITELRDDDGIIIASTTGQIPIWDKALNAFLKNEMPETDFRERFRHQPIGTLLSSLSEALNFSGRTALISTACSASTQALAVADMWLRQGLAKRVFVGGIEVLCDLTVHGFRSLQLLSEEPTRPFDAARRGINLAEGAAFLCLEAGTPESLSDHRTLAEIAGYGLSSDAYHMTAPHPEGKGSYEAMLAALTMARVSPSEVSWVHAHGTGSKHNDLAEGVALRNLFSGTSKQPPVTSTKWAHGHALGASGAIESALCVLALQKQRILPTGGLLNPDPGIALNHVRGACSSPLQYILKNTLGFGGSNAALVLANAGENR